MSIELNQRFELVEKALQNKNVWVTSSLDVTPRDRNIFRIAFRLFINLFKPKYYQEYKSIEIADKLISRLNQANMQGPLDVALVDQAQRIIKIFYDKSGHASKKRALQKKLSELETLKPNIYLRLRNLASAALNVYKNEPSDLEFEQKHEIIQACFQSLREHEGNRKIAGNELVAIEPILHEIKQFHARRKLQQLKQLYFTGEGIESQLVKYRILINQSKYKKNGEIGALLGQWHQIAVESKNKDYFAGNLSIAKLIEFRTKLDQLDITAGELIRGEIHQLKRGFFQMVEDFVDYLSAHQFILFYDFLELNDSLKGSKEQIEHCQNEFKRLQKLTQELIDLDDVSFKVNNQSAKFALLSFLSSLNEELYIGQENGFEDINFEVNKRIISAKVELAHKDSSSILLQI